MKISVDQSSVILERHTLLMQRDRTVLFLIHHPKPNSRSSDQRGLPWKALNIKGMNNKSSLPLVIYKELISPYLFIIILKIHTCLIEGINSKSSSWLSEWKAQTKLWLPMPPFCKAALWAMGKHLRRYVWWRIAKRNRKPQSSRASVKRKANY